MIAAIALAAAALATPIASMDLLCTVVSSQPANRPAPGRVDHIRVDGAAGKWCVERCMDTLPISVTENKVWLVHPQVIEGIKVLDSINRRTGTRAFTISGRPEAARSVMSTCEVKPFSGFPKRKF
jgi:hypothetical protein